MVLGEEEVEVLDELVGGEPLEVLPPVGQPARVDLSPEDQPLALDGAGVSVLLLLDSVVDADVGPVPVRHLQVLGYVHVVLLALEVKFLPHVPQVTDVLRVLPEEAVLVLDLQEDDGPAVLGEEGGEHGR